MPTDPEDTLGTYQFPCGAEIRGHRGSVAPLSKKNRVRLVVFGSDGQRPMNEGVEAPCRFDCPTPRKRKAQRGVIGNTSEVVTLVTCLATWRFGE